MKGFLKFTTEQLGLLNLSHCWKSCLCDEHGNLTRAGRVVIADLARFCKATSSSVSPPDNEITLALARRREVFNRILELVALDELQIHQLVMEEEE